MREFLLQLLQAVIIAAVPTVTVYLCSFLSKKKEEIRQSMTSETQKRLLDEAMHKRVFHSVPPFFRFIVLYHIFPEKPIVQKNRS